MADDEEQDWDLRALQEDEFDWEEGWDDGVENRPQVKGSMKYQEGYRLGQEERAELDRTNSSNT